MTVRAPRVRKGIAEGDRLCAVGPLSALLLEPLGCMNECGLPASTWAE